MKFLVRYPASAELDIKVGCNGALVPASQAARMLGFENPGRIVKTLVGAKRCFVKDERSQTVVYVDEEGLNILVDHSDHPEKEKIKEDILDVMEEAELQSRIKAMIEKHTDRYLDEIIANPEPHSTERIAADYGVSMGLLNSYLEAKGLQKWLRNRWVCEISPELGMTGHDGQNIVWSGTGRLMLFFEMKHDGILPRELKHD